MANAHSKAAADINPMPPAGLAARLRFAARRHFVLVTAFVALSSGVGAAVTVSSGTGVLAREHGDLVLVLVGLWIGSIVVSLAPLLLINRTHAKIPDIAAALCAATAEERPHLGARLLERNRSRIWREPISTFELAVIFEGVRAEHGDRARRKWLVNKRVKIEQERFVGLLQGFVGELDGAGRRAL